MGNVSDGISGMTTMYFNRDRITARKSWIFTDEFVLCLGSGISSDSTFVVTTSIDQRLKRDDLYHLNKGNWQKTETLTFSKPERFFHDKTGYILLQPSQGKALTEKRTGVWKEIMSLYPDDFTGEKDVFSLWIDHGAKPKDASYQYMILPASTKEQVKQFDINKIRVVNNTKDMQAVEFNGKIYVAAYSSVDMRLSKKISFACEGAGLFILEKAGESIKVTVADPTQKLKEQNLVINEKHLKINLPQGEMRGTSVSYLVK